MSFISGNATSKTMLYRSAGWPKAVKVDFSSCFLRGDLERVRALARSCSNLGIQVSADTKVRKVKIGRIRWPSSLPRYPGKWVS